MSAIVVLRSNGASVVVEDEIRVDGDRLTRAVRVRDDVERPRLESEIDVRCRRGEGVGLFEGFRLCSEKCP